jgi:hypothetical protein
MPAKSFRSGLAHAMREDDSARNIIFGLWGGKRGAVISAVESAFGWWGDRPEKWEWLAIRFQPSLIEVVVALNELGHNSDTVEVPTSWLSVDEEGLCPPPEHQQGMLDHIESALPETALELVGFHPERREISQSDVELIHRGRYGEVGHSTVQSVPHVGILCFLFANMWEEASDALESWTPNESIDFARKIGLDAIVNLHAGRVTEALRLVDTELCENVEKEQLTDWPSWSLIRGLARWQHERDPSAADAFLREDSVLRGRSVLPVRLAIDVLKGCGCEPPGMLRRIGEAEYVTPAKRRQAHDVLTRARRRNLLEPMKREGKAASRPAGRNVELGDLCVKSEEGSAQELSDGGREATRDSSAGEVSEDGSARIPTAFDGELDTGEEHTLEQLQVALYETVESHSALEREMKEGDLSNLAELSTEATATQKRAKEYCQQLTDFDLPEQIDALLEMAGLWSASEIESAAEALAGWARQRQEARKEHLRERCEKLLEKCDTHGISPPDELAEPKSLEDLARIESRYEGVFESERIAQQLSSGDGDIDSLAERAVTLPPHAVARLADTLVGELQQHSVTVRLVGLLDALDVEKLDSESWQEFVAKTLFGLSANESRFPEGIWGVTTKLVPDAGRFFEQHELGEALASIPLDKFHLPAFCDAFDGVDLPRQLMVRQELGDAIALPASERVKALACVNTSTADELSFLLTHQFRSLIELGDVSAAFYLATLASRAVQLDVDPALVEDLTLRVLFEQLKSSTANDFVLEKLMQPEWVTPSVPNIINLLVLGVLSRANVQSTAHSFHFVRHRYHNQLSEAGRAFPSVVGRLQHLLNLPAGVNLDWTGLERIRSDAEKALEELNYALDKGQILGGWEKYQRYFSKELGAARDRILEGGECPPIDAARLIDDASQLRRQEPDGGERRRMVSIIEQQRERLQALEDLLSEAHVEDGKLFVESGREMKSELERLLEVSSSELAVPAVVEYLRAGVR